MLEFIQSADWSILHWIQENLRCGALDALLPKLTLLGEAGAILDRRRHRAAAHQEIQEIRRLPEPGVGGGAADL